MLIHYIVQGNGFKFCVLFYFLVTGWMELCLREESQSIKNELLKKQNPAKALS